MKMEDISPLNFTSKDYLQLGNVVYNRLMNGFFEPTTGRKRDEKEMCCE